MAGCCGRSRLIFQIEFAGKTAHASSTDHSLALQRKGAWKAREATWASRFEVTGLVREYMVREQSGEDLPQ